MADPASAGPRPGHLALFYGSTTEYVMAVRSHVQASLDRGEPLCIAVHRSRLELLRAGLDSESGRVAFADLTETGRNPARIIPAMRAFIDEHRGEQVSYIAEPAWAARSAAEWREVTRHDALINLAFSGTTVSIMCPYDRMALPSSVIADARITHPAVLQEGRLRPSPEYQGQDGLPPGCELPLTAPPPWADSLVYTTELRGVRRLVRRHAAQAGLAEAAPDLVLAVGEIASNTLRHAHGEGTMHVWHTEQEILCQLHDQGQITDPLAGRVRWPPDAAGGHGLWLVNQLCDLVELRTGPQGTTTRLHMRRPAPLR